MGIGKWIGRPGRAVLLIAVGAAGAGAAIAVASVPGSDGVIHACVELDGNGHPANVLAGPSGGSLGNLRIIDPSVGQSCDTSGAGGGPAPEGTLDFNQVGPRGLAGVGGATGVAGATGAAGPPGNTFTISGEVFTLGNGHSITFSGPQTPPPPQQVRGPEIQTLTLPIRGTPETFDLASFSLGPSKLGTTGHGGGGGKASFSEFSITRRNDKDSIKLIKAQLVGTTFKTAVLAIRKGSIKTTKPFLEYDFKNVIVSGYQLNGHASPLTETISFSFASVSYTYTKQ